MCFQKTYTFYDYCYSSYVWKAMQNVWEIWSFYSRMQRDGNRFCLFFSALKYGKLVTPEIVSW